MVVLSALLLWSGICVAGDGDEPSPVELITPSVGSSEASTIRLQGQDIEGVVEVHVMLRDGGRTSLTSLKPMVLSPNELSFELPGLQAPGNYDIELTWADGATACTETPLTVFFSGCSMKPVMFPVVGDWHLDAHARGVIRDNAACLTEGGVRSAQIMGFADDRGGIIYNRDLSLLRAREVYRELQHTMPAGHGFQATLHALGEQVPVREGHTERDWVDNRRVEIRDLRSPDWRRASCAPITVGFDPGSATIDAEVRRTADEAWQCYDALHVEKIVIYASPDAPTSRDTFSSPRMDRDDESSAEREAWDLALARATALQRALPTHRWQVFPVATLPDTEDPAAGQLYDSARLVELYAQERPEPTSERFSIGRCEPFIPPPPPSAISERLFEQLHDDTDGTRGFWSLGLGAGPFAGQARAGTLGPTGWLDLRLGLRDGAFLGIGLEGLANLRPTERSIAAAPYAMVGVESPFTAALPHQAWVGVGSTGRTLMIGSDAVLGQALNRHLGFHLSLRGAVGLWTAAPWQVGVGLGASWRGPLPLRTSHSHPKSMP